MNIGLGTASFGTSISKKESFEILDRFVELGGEIIDTANNYAFWNGNGGESEAVIGQWLKTINRNHVQVHTKIGAQPIDGNNIKNLEGLSKKTITSAVQKSLVRLNTSHVDVLFAHVDDRQTPLEETWQALSDTVRKGLVKKLGISNYTPDRIIALDNVIKSNGLEPISYAQFRHTVIEPKQDADFGIQVCLTNKVKEALAKVSNEIIIVAYSPLLDGAFEVGNNLPDNYNTAANHGLLPNIRSEAVQLGVSPSAVVLWKVAEDGMLPLTMTGKTSRLAANLALFEKQNSTTAIQ